ncbi:hypothetical protein ACRCUN_17370 [Mycobacterium sp. LTG2003]
MRSALRPYATAGIAIAGASVIAVTPITAPPRDAQIRSVELSAAVQNLERPDLSAGVIPPELTPAEAYQYLFQLTTAYVFDAIAPIVSNPTPILNQVLANQFWYANLLTMGIVTGATNVVWTLSNVPEYVSTAAAQWMAGDPAAAIMTLWQRIPVELVTDIALPLIPSLQIPVAIAQNLANVVATVMTTAMELGFDALSAANNAVAGLAASVQSIVEAAGSGDPMALMNAIAVAPANILSGLLIGDIPEGGTNPGLINGVLKNLIRAREAIAEALGAESPELQAASADAGAQALAPPDLGIVFDPIAQWADIFTTAFGNVAWIGEQWLANPAPLLRQALTNQIGYATMVADTMGSVIPTTLSALFDPSYPNGLASGMVKAFELAQANDFTGASNALFSGLIGTAFGLFPMANLLQIPVQMSANLNNVLKTAASLPISLGFAAISTVGLAFQTTGTSAQAISDAINEGDTAAALSALIAAPGNITDAVLNGGQFGGGLLSDNGIIARLVVDVPRMLADAITPEVASLSKVEPETATQVPETNTVTITVEPQAEPQAEPTEPAAEAGSGESESDPADGTGVDDHKATPGENTGTPKHRKPTKLSTTLKNISEDVDKTVAKVSDGVKKALGGNKNKPKKSDEKAGADNDDDKGDNDSDGSGASG